MTFQLNYSDVGAAHEGEETLTLHETLTVPVPDGAVGDSFRTFEGLREADRRGLLRYGAELRLFGMPIEGRLPGLVSEALAKIDVAVLRGFAEMEAGARGGGGQPLTPRALFVEPSGLRELLQEYKEGGRVLTSHIRAMERRHEKVYEEAIQPYTGSGVLGSMQGRVLVSLTLSALQILALHPSVARVRDH